MPPAGRLAPFLGRPVLLLGLTREGQWKGSGRAGSVPFDLERALSECAGMLSAYGGHGAAAGFTLAAGGPYAVHDFALAFEAAAARQLPSEEDRTARQRIDLEVSLSDLSDDAYRQLHVFVAPFGQGNHRPVFLVRGARVMSSKQVGAGKRHTKIEVDQGGVRLGGIGFGMGERLRSLRVGQRLDVVFSWEENEHRGRFTKQMKLEDVRSAA